MSEKINFEYMFMDKVMADVSVDYYNKSVGVINYTDDLIWRPFGVNLEPSIDDFEEFLESRCFPKQRRNCKQLLKDLGLVNYSPLLIVQITHGVQLEDYCWIKFEHEELDYERDIKLRD